MAMFFWISHLHFTRLAHTSIQRVFIVFVLPGNWSHEFMFSFPLSHTYTGLRPSTRAPAGLSAAWWMKTRPSWRPTGPRAYLRMTPGCRSGGFALRGTETTWAELTYTHRPTCPRDTVRTNTHTSVLPIILGSLKRSKIHPVAYTCTCAGNFVLQ